MKTLSRIILMVLASAGSGTLYGETFDATVDWNRRVTIGFGMSGQVKAVEAQPGEAVPSGSVLAKLDTVLLEISLRKASNTAAISEAEMERQLAVVEREQTLYDEGSLSAVQLEQAELELSRTEFALNDAELEHQRMQHLLELATLTAPFDGWVVDSDFMPGQFVNHEADTPALMVLVERGRYLAKARIDVTAVEKLSADRAIQVHMGERVFDVMHSYIGLEPITGADGERRYLLKVQFESEDLIRPGTPCIVKVF
ncbi:MAG: hypothetical protein HN428_03445 [Proteobacteria bacterium]|nr:hypothetical protein [Pseudomonadota bacterium]